ncbi:hypothetical protein B0H17DRAFT_1193958 [Mycena rosella]|uniref:Uncharacterized protein n=1 Tax=Mycena rosella TaxID=1033263 RepID=A0AAD7GS53_MYCRO|nr:hypothetical protein B0H17DRAFT_1193958 [Mycena rosella]
MFQSIKRFFGLGDTSQPPGQKKPSKKPSKPCPISSGGATRPSKPKLIVALEAGQLNVKALIETKWDRGEFVAGMAGCSRTWLNQMVAMDTTQKVKKYFGVQHTIHHLCAMKHSIPAPHREISTEIGIHFGDLLLSQAYVQQESGRPLLDDYLMRSIPRERFGTSRTTMYRPLHSELPIPCPHPSCNGAGAVVTSVSTEWPLLLRLDPLWRSRDAAVDPDLHEVVCPLVLKLGRDVEYRLISRVVFIPPRNPDSIGHYVTKTRVKVNTYFYNDCQRNGSLTELGPLCLLEEHDRTTSWVLYLRMSKASTTSRTVAEIEEDFAKIPIRPTQVIPISDNSDDEFDQMLFESVTSPTKKCRMPPFPTPSPPREESHGYVHGPKQNPTAVGAPDISFADTDSNTPCPLFCEGCDTFNADGDDDEREFQRSIVMLPDSGSADWKSTNPLWYPARFIKGHEKRANQPNEYVSSFLFSLSAKIDQIGRIRRPLYMEPDNPNHENPALTAVFNSALPRIAQILAEFNHDHPVIKDFNEYFAGKKEIQRHRGAGQWMADVGLVPTPELEAVLMAPLSALLRHGVLSHLIEDERNQRVMGVGSVLLQLLEIQMELGEPLNLNGDLLVDLRDRAVTPCPTDGAKALARGRKLRSGKTV